MRNIVIILVLAIAGAVIGLLGTAEVARQLQNSARDEPKPVTGNTEKDMQESLRYLNNATDDMAKRQTYAMIGGGVGLVVGLLAGLAYVTMTDRKRKASATVRR